MGAERRPLQSQVASRWATWLTAYEIWSVRMQTPCCRLGRASEANRSLGLLQRAAKPSRTCRSSFRYMSITSGGGRAVQRQCAQGRQSIDRCQTTILSSMHLRLPDLFQYSNNKHRPYRKMRRRCTKRQLRPLTSHTVITMPTGSARAMVAIRLATLLCGLPAVQRSSEDDTSHRLCTSTARETSASVTVASQQLGEKRRRQRKTWSRRGEPVRTSQLA